MASTKWNEDDFENFHSSMELVMACKETTEEDVADFCSKEVVGNFVTNSYCNDPPRRYDITTVNLDNFNY